MSSTPSEFQIIKRYFEGVGELDTDVINLGIGDDCAVISLPEGKSLCFSLDTMVEGRHFPRNISPEKLAIRSMAAALSDLAAMGAEPSFFTLSLTLPEADADWLEGFSKGLKSMAKAYQLRLVGGDTTCGPLTIGIQVHGLVDRGRELRRDGAKFGDVLVVSGSLGDAGAALELLDREVDTREERYLLDRYFNPTPRFKESAFILPYASSCIDISDGLIADARHIAEASNCCLKIDLEALPLSKELQEFAGHRAAQLALSSGDDYELLFTVSEQAWYVLKERSTDMMFTAIGKVVAGSENVQVYSGGQEIVVDTEGFKHFE